MGHNGGPRVCPHCGCSSDPAKRPRSVAQLRRFFAVLRAMANHWPEGHEFQPESQEHLRKWIICRAGPEFRESVDIPLEFATEQPGLTKLAAMAIQSAIVWAGAFAFIRPDSNGGRVRVYRAKSMALHKMAPAEFNALNDAVEAAYEAETGMKPDTVLDEQQRAA